MGDYLSAINRSSGAQQQLARLSTVLGASSLTRNSGVAHFVRGMSPSAAPDIPDGLQTVAGAAAGYYLWRGKHRWLGVIAGASVGRNALALALHPEMRRTALTNMAQTGGGIAGSLMFKAHPVWGFILGWFGAGAALYMSKVDR
jgi:hypothetical protein